MTTHRYATTVEWSGSTGSGYRQYDRTHTVTPEGASPLLLSADPAFRGDSRRANPEQLLLAAASSCQLLSFLAETALAGIDVVRYRDEATASMPDDASPVRLSVITLRPVIAVRGADPETVRRLVREAHRQCYIANSLTTPVEIEATVEVLDA